jgi:deazaflavin-dependent oxidoreductase (nitroreductase family)
MHRYTWQIGIRQRFLSNSNGNRGDACHGPAWSDRRGDHRTMLGMPSDLVLKSMNAVHRAMLKVTGGRIGREVSGMPVVELITTGRRSGQPRAVMLTSPLRDGDAYVVVASRGGDDRHPAWFLNLRDDPHVQVSVQNGPRVPMDASVATPEERARLWPQIAGKYQNYAGYQKRTEREIPLVLLRPTA